MGGHAGIRRIVVVGTWTIAALIWLFFLATQQFLPTEIWLLDWHVYSAGARDFLAHDLYYIPLESAYRIPVDAFNYPPLSAIAVLPLVPLPDALGGNIWVVLNIVAMAGTAVLTASI